MAATILGLPLLAGLRFDFNPLNLRAQDAELIATVLDLMNFPDTSPNTIDVLRSNLAEAAATAERLRALPEVGRVVTLQSFVPKDQEAKLALIEDASFFLRNTLNPDEIDAGPTPAETEAAIDKLARDLSDAAHGLGSPAAEQALRLAGFLAPLANAAPAALEEARHALIAPLETTLRQVRSLLAAEPVSIETLPPALKKSWMSSDGRAPGRGGAAGRCQRQRTVAPLRHGGSQCRPRCGWKTDLRHRSRFKRRHSISPGWHSLGAWRLR